MLMGLEGCILCSQWSQSRGHMKNTLDSGTCMHGVKGPSPLMLLTFFNTVAGFAYDYMHGILLGVCCQLTTLWFASKYHTEPWYIRREIEQTERRLLANQPPAIITRPPCSISLRKYWKASEFRHYFTAFPVCLEFCPNNILTTYDF